MLLQNRQIVLGESIQITGGQRTEIILGLGSEMVSGYIALNLTIVFGESIEHLAINKAPIIYADKAPE